MCVRVRVCLRLCVPAETSFLEFSEAPQVPEFYTKPPTLRPSLLHFREGTVPRDPSAQLQAGESQLSRELNKLNFWNVLCVRDKLRPLARPIFTSLKILRAFKFLETFISYSGTTTARERFAAQQGQVDAFPFLRNRPGSVVG